MYNPEQPHGNIRHIKLKTKTNTTVINVRETEEAIKNVQSRETGNIVNTRHKSKTNKIENTTQYILDITIHKTKTKKNKKQNTAQYVLDIIIHKQT